jgi:hypothetical protein
LLNESSQIRFLKKEAPIISAAWGCALGGGEAGVDLDA